MVIGMWSDLSSFSFSCCIFLPLQHWIGGPFDMGLLVMILSLTSLTGLQAGNILVDGNGTIKLGDFGVSACMFDTGDRQRSRITFVGTPCWYFSNFTLCISKFSFLNVDEIPCS